MPVHLDDRKGAGKSGGEKKDGGRQRPSDGAIIQLWNSYLRMFVPINFGSNGTGALKIRESIVRLSQSFSKLGRPSQGEVGQAWEQGKAEQSP
jgi:hypothetical protein